MAAQRRSSRTEPGRPPPFRLTPSAAEYTNASFVVSAGGDISAMRGNLPGLPQGNIFEVWQGRADVIALINAALDGSPGSGVAMFDEATWAFHVIPLDQQGETAVICIFIPVSRLNSLGISAGRISKMALTVPNLPELLRRATSEIAHALGADQAVVLQRSGEESGSLRVWGAFPEETFSGGDMLPGQGIERQAMEGGQTLHLTLDEQNPSAAAGFLETAGKVVLCVPMGTGARPIAVTAVYRDRLFDEDECGFLESAASVLGQAAEKWQARELSARLTAVLDATTDLVMLARTDGRCIYINPAARRLIGMREGQEASSISLGDFRPEWARLTFEEHALPAATANGIWHGESAFLTPEGREVPVSQVVIAHQDQQGRIERLSAISRDISEIKLYQEQIALAAAQDPLTGVPNRRHFLAEIDRVLRQGDNGAIVYLDLDDFKAVNDTLGHAAGDKFLTHLAGILPLHLRDEDVFARLGGDEFAILLPGMSSDQALAMAERVLQSVRAFKMSIRNRTVRTTASIGVAMYREHGAFVDELLANSDMALYKAKDSGRNRVVLYDPVYGGREVSAARLRWRQKIPEALQNDRFTFYAQPIYHLNSRNVAAYELLLRVRDNRGRITRPSTLLEIAETSGLIHDIDHWVVQQAIQVASQIQKLKLPFDISANLSAKALTNDDLLEQIKTEVLLSDVRPDRVCFEITETAAVNNVTQAQSFLKSLKGFGFRLALDDFGVGFASFAQLRNLPIDYIKIDGAFVSALPVNKNDQHFVKAIAEVVQSLGISAVAEFVGSEDTIRILQAFGVSYGQGYYLGKPMPLNTIFRRRDEESQVA